MQQKEDTQDFSYGKMSEELSTQTKEKISKPLSKKLETSGRWTLAGGYSMPLISERLSDECEYLLSQILEENVPEKYSLSQRACSGILQRAERREKALPAKLKKALTQISQSKPNTTSTNQPNEEDLNVFVKASRAISKDDYESWKDEEDTVAPTLNGFDNMGEAFATVLAVTDIKQNTIMRYIKRDEFTEDNRSSTLTTKNNAANGGSDIVIEETQTLALTEREGKEGGGKGLLLTEEKSPTLRAGGIQSIAEPTSISYRIRRLTPRECERLMGWPDDHTRFDDEGNELKDSARYKMCGNGISAPVAQFICENIVNALANEEIK